MGDVVERCLEPAVSAGFLALAVGLGPVGLLTRIVSDLRFG
ncbi:hypothetical protein [Streptomyces lienomycini]|nr:hypothetical protein [Streptomyces lienomycini]